MLAAITVNGNISLGSIGTFLAGLAAFAGVWRRVGGVKAKVDDTHALVNSTADELAAQAAADRARVEQLGEVITGAGGKVPPRP